MFRARCHACEATIKVKDDAAAGRRARCPRCGSTTLLDPLVDKPLDDDLGLGDLVGDEHPPDVPEEEEQSGEHQAEPIRFGPRGAPTPTPPPPKSPTPSPLPPHWVDNRLGTTALIWEGLTVLCLVWALVSAVGGLYWGGVATTEDDLATSTSRSADDAGGRFRYGEDPAAPVAHRMAAAAARVWSYAAYASAGSSIFLALVSWTTAGFLWSSATPRPR